MAQFRPNSSFDPPPPAGDPGAFETAPVAEGRSGSAIDLGTIYFTLFRHKWKIVLGALLGIAAAAAAFHIISPPFKSRAQLLIRYVQEKRAPTLDEESRIIATTSQADSIIRTEVAILSSFDLARQVAESLGPARIVGADLGPDTVKIATAIVRQGLLVEAPPRGNIVNVDYSHANPLLVQPILDQVVQSYLKRHGEVHRTAEVFDDTLTQETDQLRDKLNRAEDDLRKLKERARVISIEDAKKNFSEQLARLNAEILAAEVEIAAQRATMAALTGRPVETGPASAGDSDLPVAVVPDDKATAYRQVIALLDTLYRRETEHLNQFTAEAAPVKRIRAQIAENEAIKARLEQEFPALRSQPPPRLAQPAATPGAAPTFDPALEAARIQATESRITVLKNQVAQIRSEFTALSEMETAIKELERRRDLLDEQYRYFARNLEQRRIDDALRSGRVSNISVVQNPTPPVRDMSQVLKIMLACVAGGLGLGVGLAFALELFLDPTVKRPREIESSIGLPLMLSIPRLRASRRLALPGRSTPRLGPGRGRPAAHEPAPSPGGAPDAPNGLVPAAGPEGLRTFFDALRNRLIYSFEMRNITRKPKLVAVTSCGSDSGVSTIAAGLAASLSETGDGNVLLVDMNPDRKNPQFFHRGDLKVGLDDVLANETRDDAMVSENLYMVSQGSAEDRLSWIIPKRFASLVPKMKASDFDYIIFDMPPVSQISATPQLARYMDQVLMVVESEKTPRDAVKRAGAMLADAGANVGVILNKTRSYLPEALSDGD